GAQRRLGPRLTLQGGLAAPGTLALVGEEAHPAFVPAALGEAAWAPRPWVALAAGASARVAFAPAGSLRAVAARAWARFRAGRRWFFALGSELPIAGADRTDVIVSLFAGAQE